MTKRQGRTLQDLQRRGEWVTAWGLGRDESDLEALVVMKLALVDRHYGFDSMLNYYRAA